jgi:hypothetical protein
MPDLPDCPGGVIIFGSTENNETVHYGACPDGTSLVEIVPDYQWYDPESLSQHNLHVRIAEDRHVLIVENASGEPIHRLVDNSSLVLIDADLSFDGKYVAYGFIDNNRSAYGLGIVALESGTSSLILAPDEARDISVFAVNCIRWSPNSYKLLIYWGTAPTQVMNINCDSNTHTCQGQVEGQPGEYTDTCTDNPWSPDGRLIAYPCYTATSTNGEVRAYHALCVQDPLGEMLYEFQESDLGISDITSLRWSPDSSHLVFTAHAKGRPDSDIFVLSLPDRSLSNFTANLPGDQDSPLWLP